jgi:hypothetical protein
MERKTRGGPGVWRRLMAPTSMGVENHGGPGGSKLARFPAAPPRRLAPDSPFVVIVPASRVREERGWRDSAQPHRL